MLASCWPIWSVASRTMSDMRLTGEPRQARDELVWSMFVAGVPYRAIGKRTDLSLGGVHKAVTRMLASRAPRRRLLLDEAVAVYQERLEALWASAWLRAVNGDPRSQELCRKLLDQMARSNGIYASGEPLVRDNQPDDDDDEDDELTAWRKRRELPGYVGSYTG